MVRGRPRKKVEGEKEVKNSDLSLVNAWYWAYYNKIKLQAGFFELKGHEYLIGPMTSKAHKKATKKGAQMGFTEGEIIVDIHGMITGVYLKGVLYLFPTDDDVSEFSKSRFKPLIQNNSYHIGRYIGDTSAVNIKQIQKSNLFLHGARPTQKVQGIKKESAGLRSRAVDKIVFDEIDLMDETMIPIALERFSHSDVKEEVYLSTPTIPDYGIDRLYSESNQNHWMIKCSSCGRDCCLELDFPECVKFKDGKAYRACVKCGKELNPSDGEWVAKESSVKDFDGYWISQLNSLYIDPGEILRLFENPPNGNLQEVYNSKLAMAYIAAENRLTVNDIFSSCGTHPMATEDRWGPCGMGIDVGKTLHVVIGKKMKWTAKKKILWVGDVPEFEDVVELGKRFNVKQAAIDCYPETRKAREFKKNAGFPVMLCTYKDKIKEGLKQDFDLGMMELARTEICDQTHMAIKRGEYIFPRKNASLEEYAKQMSNIAKILEEDEKRGTKIYRYRKLGPDHFRHATNYFEVAVKNLSEAYEQDPMRSFLETINESKKDDYNPLTYGLA